MAEVALVDRFRQQAHACQEMGSPIYAALLERLADDLEDGGVTAAVVAGHEHDPGPSALALRLLGSVHRLVLDGSAPELATFYPSVGGEWEPTLGWAAFERLMREQPERVREWLDRPPQTNEVGRSGALMGGLLEVGRRFSHPVRLFEIGASAGLNLRADRFGYTDDHNRLFGNETSTLVLRGAWRGRPLRPWRDLEVVERLGSDLMPVDPSSEEGRLTLRAYVWPDQTERLERLDAALEVAEAVRVEVRRQGAVPFVEDLDLARGTTTVLWHSVMWQYLSGQDKEAVSGRVAELGAAATRDEPFAHLFLEPARRTPDSEHEFLVVLELWPEGDRRILGRSVGHGIPTTWE
jgi:hypothetical protein